MERVSDRRVNSFMSTREETRAIRESNASRGNAATQMSERHLLAFEASKERERGPADLVFAPTLACRGLAGPV